MENLHPPAVQMTVRVGVTGHRSKALNALEADETVLRDSIRKVLRRICTIAEDILQESKQAYAPGKPVLRVISPLAEGSDRLVAEEALSLKGLNYELQTPLPFAQDEYEVDFETEESRSQFRSLLKQSAASFILDGTREGAELAYAAVGQVVLRQSDVLIAIWDGKAAKGSGGTGNIVKDALVRKIPTVLIEASPPHSISLLDELSESGEPKSIRSLDEIVTITKKQRKPGFFTPLKYALFPSKERKKSITTTLFEARLRNILSQPQEEQMKMLRRFLTEQQPQFRAAFLYRLFCRVFVSSWNIPKCEVAPFDTDHEKDWLAKPSSQETMNTQVHAQIEKHYRKPFVWSDVIADMCADRYRSSFVAVYLLGALAVLSAFLGAPPDRFPALITGITNVEEWFYLELVCIGGIATLVLLNKLFHWRERWIDYRLLAEGLRQMRALALFARVTPTFEVPAHLSDDAPDPTWFNWYFRAVVRSAGLLQASITGEYLKECRAGLISEIGSQVKYHLKNARRHEALHRRLHRLSLSLFVITLLACLLHLWYRGNHGGGGILMLCAIVLPAFGAALQGIILQGEFGRLSHRSRALNKRLTKLRNQIKTSSHELSCQELGKLTELFSEIQILEQTDWRSVFIIKELSLT
ncbi:MAG TPA: hypothetical protein VF173_07020 [Thermoanaerobaculia bacterium]|nr:hypothetical protein [Thermoanaerobaculia bacterium]